MTWRNLLILLLSLSLAAFSLNPRSMGAAEPSWQSRVDPWVLQQAQNGETEFILFLKQQADLSAAAQLSTKAEKGAFVYHALKKTADESQPPLLRYLEAQGLPHRPFWIANMVWVRGDLQALQALARRSDVARVYANPSVQLDQAVPAPVERLNEALPGADTALPWNLSKVGVEEVWQAGFTGQGVVIGGQDTGYDWTHPALKAAYRGWNGTSADHNYSWHDAIHEDSLPFSSGNRCGYESPEPCDDGQHGTHTMGIMVGAASGQIVGMAPGAKWIGCRNMENGVGSPATYSECFQWFLAPTDLEGNNPRPDLAPDIVNNSWSCPPSEGCTNPDVLLAVVSNLRTAGILSVQAAGNSGPTCGTIDTPAAIYEASFTVGSTNANDEVVSSSSRGPVTVDGSWRTKPDIAAPGAGIISTVPGGGYMYLSGTSMASPHAAGLAALLISANPDLHGQVDQLETIIKRSAAALPGETDPCTIPGEGGIPNNSYGWGRIDAAAALRYATRPLLVQKSAATFIEPGAQLQYILQAGAGSQSQTNVVLTDNIPAGTALVSATGPYEAADQTITWTFPHLQAGETRTVSFIVQLAPEAADTITNSDYRVSSDEFPQGVSGAPVTTVVAYARFFPFMMQASQVPP